MSLVNRGHHLRFQPDIQILKPGEQPSSILFITQGWMSIHRLTESGDEVTTRLYGPSEIVFGDLLFRQPSPLNIGATSKVPVHAFGIPSDLMRQALLVSPKLSINLLAIVAKDMHNMGYMLEQIAAYSAVERVEKLLLKIMLTTHGKPVSTFILPVKKNELAHLLGITRETFSRNLHELESRITTGHNNEMHLSDARDLCHTCDLYTAALCERFNEPAFCRFANECKKSTTI